MKFPKKLIAGATVGVVAASSPVEAGRAKLCQEKLEAMGFAVKLADNLETPKGGYLAGDAKVRGEWINRMFADKDVDAIFCIRGGDGGNQTPEYIDLDIVRANKKIFVGYSDVTTLHILFNQQCDLVTFHGPMVSSNMIEHFDEETEASFFDALTGETCYEYPAPKGFPVGILHPGSAEGLLTGGNLEVLCASIGTSYEIETKGKILFLEEVHGHIGNLDRHIYQLKNAGKLKDATGILLGQFTDCRMDEEDYGIVEVVKGATKDLDIPIMYNIQSGHGFPMMTLPMGAVCRMDTAGSILEFQIER